MTCRSIVFLLILSSLIGLTPLPIHAEELLKISDKALPKVEWQTDYDTARKLSKDSGKMIFLVFSTQECVYCRKLEATSFKDPQVAKMLSDDFIPLKVDGNASPNLAKALRIKLYPSIVMAAPDGKIIGFLEGYMEPERLSDLMTRGLAMLTPDGIARDFEEANKALSRGDYAKAIPMLQAVLEDGKLRPVQIRAKQLLDEIEQQAANKLVLAKELQDKKKTAEAFEVVTELLARYPNTGAAKEGAKFLSRIGDHPELQLSQRNQRARDLLAQAKEALKAEKYHTCLELAELLERSYADTEAGRQGAILADEIRNNPERMTRACNAVNERLASMYLVLAETYLKKGDKETATVYLLRATSVAPGSSAASDASVRLTSITGKTPAVSTGFTKPEK